MKKKKSQKRNEKQFPLKTVILLILIHVIFLYIDFGIAHDQNEILQNSSSFSKFNLLSPGFEQNKTQTQNNNEDLKNETALINQTQTENQNNKTSFEEEEISHQDVKNITQEESEKQNNKTSLEETNPNKDAKNITQEESDDEDFFINEEEQSLTPQERPFYKTLFPNPKPYDDEFRSMQIPEGTYIEVLEISCAIHDPDHLNIIIRDGKHPRFEVPQKDPYPHSSNPQYLTLQESNFELQTHLGDPFDIIVKRKDTQEIIFKLSDRFIFTDLYIEFTFRTPTKEIYGLGSRISTLQFKPGTYSLFMIDRSGAIDIGQPGYNGQGHHPMYLMKENSGKYHTFLLRNVNFQELIIRDEPKVTWKVTGGVLDFNFFLGGNSPESAVEKYHEYLGGWVMPAFWHLGYHLNKWAGYKNIKDLEYVLDNFHQKNIPLDSLWTDADHMKDHNNFSIDEINFPLDQVRDLYAKHKKKWVVLLNAHISLPLLPPASEYSHISQLFMKDSLSETCNGSFLWGKVNFLDFLHPRCEDFWGKMLDSVHQKWDYAGVWLDANEVSNLEKKDAAYYRKAWSRKYYSQPFYPGEKNYYYLNIINVDCAHYKGQDEFNVRTFNALLQTKYTYDTLLKRSPFPFVLSRATLFGGSKYAFTWIPDVWSDWDSFKISLASLLTHNIFGYTMAGVDICGFVSATMTEPELCARWHQLAVFYPFARNSHIFNGRSSTNQEPYRYNGVFYDTILQAIKQRYAMLKYLYTLFLAKKNRVGTILRPLFFEFSNDPSLPPYGDRVHEEQFLLGDSIMVAPVFEERKESVSVYFPNVRWYDLRNSKEIETRGVFSDIQAKLIEPLPFFLKGGAIFFIQEVDETVLSTQDLGNVFKVFVGLDDFIKEGEVEIGRAKGNVIAASSFDEESIHKECIQNNCILTMDIQFGNENNQPFLIIQLQGSEQQQKSFTLNQLIIMGIPEEIRLRENLKQTVLENHTELLIETSFLEIGALKLIFDNLSLKPEIVYKFLFSENE